MQAQAQYAAPALQSLAHRTGWLPFDSDLKVVDGGWVDGLPEPLWVGLAQAPGLPTQTYFLALAQRDGSWHDVSATPLYQRDFVRLLARQGRVALARGAIVFEASGPLPWAGLQLRVADLGGSSNCVSQLDVGGLRAMHKVFRKLSGTDYEVSACRLLQDAESPTIPRHLGAYQYVAPDGASLSLGVLNELFEGHGLHADLSSNLRALWRLADDLATPGVDSHLAQLRPELLRWRAFLERFHSALDRSLGLREGPDAPDFDMAGFGTQVRQRLGRLEPLVRADPLLGAVQAERLAELLVTVGHVLFDPASLRESTLKASGCHGDLHLSHLLWRGQGDEAERRLIDISPLATRADQAAFRCSHRLMDWVALARALDYFFLDESTFELKRLTGVSSSAAMQQQLLAELGTVRPGLVSDWQVAVERMGPLGRAWREQVQQALCGDPGPGRAWQQFYFARLLQELDYNYAHRRAHFRCIDFHSLLRTFKVHTEG